MQIHHDIEHLPAFKNAVVTFGSFDGVHLGHAGIIAKMAEIATEIDGETIVVTFDPHPRQIIYPLDDTLKLLSSKSEKIRQFEKTGVDHLVFCPFTIEFSQLDPNEYIEKFILGRFHPKRIVIGYDHRFGLNRSGNIDFLRSFERSGGFKVFELPQQVTDEIQISSTRIRKYIAAANIERANMLLGYPYQISGKVVRGEQIGERIGYPTANVLVESPSKLIPPEGIYAAQVIYQGRKYGGMMYIGTRPTVTKSGKKSIEVNIFNFTEDIYDEQLTIEVLRFLRPDQTFASLDGLRRQLDQDKILAQEHLNSGDNSFAEAAVIILNFNGQQHLENYLPSVIRFSAGCQIIVADNHSTDDSVAFLRKEYPQVKIIQLEKNLGFAGGYNAAIKLVNAEYLVLLNTDVEVTSQWASKLIDFISVRPEVGAVQPKVKSYKNKNTFEYAGAGGGLLDKLGYPFCQGRILSEVEEDVGQYDRVSEIFWTTGAAMVIRKNVFQKSGGFDADFFAHMEEIDLCWRLKQSGYKMYVVPSSVVYHLGGGTLSYESPHKTYLNFRNGMSLLLKNEKGLTLLWLLPVRLVLDMIAGLRFLLIGEYANAKAVIRSMSYTFFHLPEIFTKRKRILAIRDRIKVGPSNVSAGRYQGSIIWEFFIMGRKKYHDLRYVAKRLL